MRRRSEQINFVLRLLVAGVLSVSTPVLAQDQPSADYELLIVHHRLVVSLDIQSFLTDEYLTRVKEGIDLVLECRLGLKTPRRIFGSRTVSETTQSLQISYRSITEDFVVRVSSDWKNPRLFLTQADIRSFLSDSIKARLAGVDSLNYEQPYTLALKVVAISVSDLGLGRGSAAADSSNSPVDYLFRRFLTLTGYGRREFSFESRPFLLSELESEP
jgi:hypothetical protein